jgi:CRISPR-associated endonuclease/helicase Cas3
VGDVPALYRDLRRVEVVKPDDLRTPTSWDELSHELCECERVLCIVSDRKSCRELYSLLPQGSYHLSALMCAQHRSDRIAEIKRRLKKSEAVRLISTQLVEAGVDISFPIVYRAMAGLDSIAQAAGRCNREGELKEAGRLGKVVVFVPPRQAPPGILRKASETARRMLELGLDDPIDSAAFAPYFSELYWKANSLDRKGIMGLLEPDKLDCGIQFRSAAEAFQIIDAGSQRTILVPYGEGEKLIDELKAMGPERWLLRKLQRYSVNVYNNQFNALLARGSIEEIGSELYALTCAIEYDDAVGLLVDESPTDPASFIA